MPQAPQPDDLHPSGSELHDLVLDPTAPESLEQALDHAWTRHEAGAPDQALAVLAQLDAALADQPLAGYLAGERARLGVEAHLALLDLTGAQRALAAAEARPSSAAPAPDDDHNLCIARGELALATWELEPAETAFAAILELPHFDAPFRIAHDRLALIADVAGRFDQADTHFAASHGRPAVRLAEADFEAEVERALQALPPPFQAVFERVPLVLDDMPTRELATAGGHNPLEVPADVLGLFLGPSDLDRSSFEFPTHPAHIRLFQRNIERIAETREHLAEEITTTLYHELGHALGHDEDGVDAMGLH